MNFKKYIRTETAVACKDANEFREIGEYIHSLGLNFVNIEQKINNYVKEISIPYNYCIGLEGNNSFASRDYYKENDFKIIDINDGETIISRTFNFGVETL